jgi:uncharacterized protein
MSDAERGTRSTSLTFPAADGGSSSPAPVLSGRLRLPVGEPIGAAVLSHPHPAFGGNMDVWLLARIGEVLADRGWAVLRYDVRGAGGSQPGPGRWDGAEEQHDLAGAIARMRDEVAPDAPIALVGWSFGALLGLLAGPSDPRVTDWIGVAPPTGPLDGVPMVQPDLDEVRRWAARRTVIVGSHDQHFPPATVEVLAPHATVVVDAADHFLFDRDDEVAGHVAAALARHHPPEEPCTPATS